VASSNGVPVVGPHWRRGCHDRGSCDHTFHTTPGPGVVSSPLDNDGVISMPKNIVVCSDGTGQDGGVGVRQ
jgi:hypothetical protein